MTKAMWAKKILAGVSCLVPDCVDAETWLGKTKLDQRVLIDPKRPRHPLHHKKFFAVVNLACENWPQIEGCGKISRPQIVALIKFKTGHVDMIKGPDGTIFTVPKSMNFASMSQDEFDPFYQDAMIYLGTVLGVDPETLNSEAHNQ
jgi:hypothetical protein